MAPTARVGTVGGSGSFLSQCTYVGLVRYSNRLAGCGAYVPISGTGRVVESLEWLLPSEEIAAVNTLAQAMNRPIEGFVTPGLTIVVESTLLSLTSPHVSATAAVDLVRRFSSAAAAEMDPRMSGIVTYEEAIGTIRRRLAWARTPLSPMPPFTTPFGPSVFWFYRGDGTIVDMTQGFYTIPGKAEEDCQQFLERLTEHIRATRGMLMSREYATATTGSFLKRTIASPIHRVVADEFHVTFIMSENLQEPQAAAQFVRCAVQRIVGRTGTSAGNVHAANLERKAAITPPSLLNAVNAFGRDRTRAEPRPLSLIRRVELGLGNRSVENLAEPPAPIWVPVDNDPNFVETLVRVQREQALARVAALRRRVRSTPVDCIPIVPGEGMGRRKLENFQRHLTRYLRHEAQTRPDGYVSIATVLAAVNEERASVDTVLQICETDIKGRLQ